MSRRNLPDDPAAWVDDVIRAAEERAGALERERQRRGEAPATHGLSETLARRVEEVVREAEERAAEIQRRVEDEREWTRTVTQRYLMTARRRVGELTEQQLREVRTVTDDLLEKAAVAKGQLDALIAALDEAQAVLLADREPPWRELAEELAAPSPPSPPKPRTQEVEPPSLVRPPHVGLAAPEPQPAAPRPVARDEAAALVALDMALSGSSREETAAALRDTLGVEDADDILDDIYETRGWSDGPSR